MIQRIKNQIVLMRTDPHIREVARGTMVAFVLKIAGSSLTFAFNVVVARQLGAEGTGIFYLALAVTTIGSVIGRAGLDNALLRFIAMRTSHHDWAGVNGIYALSMSMAIVASAIISIAVFLIAPWIAFIIFNKPELAEPLRWMSLSIFPLTLLNLQAESLKGLKQIRSALIVQSIGVPGVALLLVYPLVVFLGNKGVLWAYVIATALIALMGIVLWRHAMSHYSSKRSTFSFNMLWESCRPLLIAALINQAVMPFLPILLLGFWTNSEDVGVFGVATRVATLVSFMLVTVNIVVGAKFAELFAKGDIETLGQTARRSAFLTTVLSSPVFLVLILLKHRVMALFGSDFENGAEVLSILLVGQFVNVACGSVGYLLNMTGHEKVNTRLTALSGFVLAILACILIPWYGTEGAALAASTGLIVFNLAASIMVYRLLNIRVFWFKISDN